MIPTLRTLPLLLALAHPFACRPDAQADAPTDAPKLPRSQVHVVRADGAVHKVEVELAFDDPTRSRGLMFRKSMPDTEGMLFVFDVERVQSFWMKNTLIPLDMLFIRPDGTIAGVVENAVPLTETPRGVPEPSRYVLEVNGGWCAKRGIRRGDRVELGEALAATEAARARPAERPLPGK